MARAFVLSDLQLDRAGRLAVFVAEQILLVDLYFAKPRPVVDRDGSGSWLMMSACRWRREIPEMRTVRFRTLGCYPATAAIDSEADSLESIIEEMLRCACQSAQGVCG